MFLKKVGYIQMDVQSDTVTSCNAVAPKKKRGNKPICIINKLFQGILIQKLRTVVQL
jgi:hypothetical protein